MAKRVSLLQSYIEQFLAMDLYISAAKRQVDRVKSNPPHCWHNKLVFSSNTTNNHREQKSSGFFCHWPKLHVYLRVNVFCLTLPQIAKLGFVFLYSYAFTTLALLHLHEGP